ncbi:MAG: type II secretion system protein GspG [Acidobacteriota bacterium]|nr:type II secretion system protein GspG [Acidobacteriota bacterium]
MNGFRIIALLALVCCLAACASSRKLSPDTARTRILKMGLMEIEGKTLEVRKVRQVGGKQAVAEASLNMVFQLTRNSRGKWEVEAVRFSDGNWVQVETLREALDMTRDRQTRQDLGKLVKGINEYKKIHGDYPRADNLSGLNDLLFPRHMGTSIRFDAWGRPLILQRTGPEGLLILSLGADGIRGSEDDISLTP